MNEIDLKNLWPLYVKAKEDELLSSWMFRNAHNHHQKIYTFFKKYIDNSKGDQSKIWSVDLDRNPRNDIVLIMSKYTDSSYEKVLSTSLKHFEGRLFESIIPNGNTRWVLPMGHHHTKSKRMSLQYCPSCLLKDQVPYFRKRWKLSISFVCIKCRAILRDSCWSCGAGINFIRSELGRKNEFNLNHITICHNCQSDLRHARFQSSTDEEYKLQKILYDYIDLGHTPHINYSHLYFDGLYQICGIILTSRKTVFPLQFRIAKECSIRFKPILDEGEICFDYLDVKRRMDVLKMAHWLLDQWPERFLSIMKQTKSGLSIQFLNCSDKSKMPFWYFSHSYAPGSCFISG